MSHENYKKDVISVTFTLTMNNLKISQSESTLYKLQTPAITYKKMICFTSQISMMRHIFLNPDFLLFHSKLRTTTIKNSYFKIIKVEHINAQKQTEASANFTTSHKHIPAFFLVHIKVFFPILANTVFVIVEDKVALPMEKLVMDIGTEETFRCTLKNETTFIRWYNSTGQELHFESGGGIKTFPDGTFTIERVKLSDGGTYTCKGLKYIQYYTIYVNGRSDYFRMNGYKRCNEAYLDSHEQ